MMLHFEGLNCICHSCCQISSLLRSSWRLSQSESSTTIPYKRVSLANSLTVEVRPFGRSLMYVRNNNGPSTDPCGTPEVTGEEGDAALSQMTVWTLLVRKDFIQDKRRLKPFVANRVAEIQQKSDPAQWRHVSTEQNPANDTTRGLDLKKLSTKSRWFQGPTFLHEGETSWPSESHLFLSDCSEEGKQELAKIKLTFQCKQSLPLFDIQRFSSWC